MSAGIMRRPVTHRPDRRKNPEANKPQPTAPITVTGASIAGSVLTLTFDQPVALKGVPNYAIVGVVGADAVSAVRTTPTTVAITYDTALLGATSVTIPYEEPAIRNSSGGFVRNSTFPIS